MRTPIRGAFRLVLTGWLGLAGLVCLASQGQAADQAPPEKVLPDSTILFVKVNNAAKLREAFRQSQFGQLWSDPGLKPFKEDIASKLDDASKSTKEKLGVGLRELLELPQGTASLALVGKDDDKTPIAIVLTADAGKNASTMTEVLSKATKQGEQAGARVSTEDFKGHKLTIIVPPKPKGEKDNDRPQPPIVWTHEGSVFTIATDTDLIKDVIGNASGRENSLASTENYAAALKKLGSDPHVIWFADVAKALQLVVKAGAKGKNAANIEQFKAMSQVLGINGLKAASGSFTLNSGAYDSVTRTFVLAPAPVQGFLRLFQMPAVSLKPEQWVPATVASYQTWSWDLDGAFKAVNDLANMFQPGVLNVLEQQLVGPNGGEPLNFKKDVFDPLGDRLTLISDYKKPVTEESQRMLLAVALEDQSAFQNTLTKLIGLTGGAPKKREFQGTTIYDFEMPEIPNAKAGNVQIKGPISVAVAKNTVFVSSEPTLMELVLRGGGSALSDSPAYQSVAKEVPNKVSSLSYVRPDEQARVSYDMIKNGQFEKALQGAAVAGGPDVSKLGKLINKDKLPDYSVFAKYLSQGGGYGVMSEDGMTFTNFTLRKSNP
ncbi:MAG: hypothetical protein NVSMB9_15520 [Isosphaeraceae bacterium]